MEVPLEIVFEGMAPTDAIRARVAKEAARLEQFHGRITSCRVVVEAPRHHKAKGGLFNTRIHLTLPQGGDIVAGRSPAAHHAHEDVYVSIRDAFDAAQRQLEDEVRVHRGKVKHHDVPPHGRVRTLHAYEGYGFIETPGGREVYFHRNSVLDGKFDTLEVGDEVRFAEEMGDKGPQATTVRVVGKHHPT